MHNNYTFLHFYAKVDAIRFLIMFFFETCTSKMLHKNLAVRSLIRNFVTIN